MFCDKKKPLREKVNMEKVIGTEFKPKLGKFLLKKHRGTRRTWRGFVDGEYRENSICGISDRQVHVWFCE